MPKANSRGFNNVGTAQPQTPNWSNSNNNGWTGNNNGNSTCAPWPNGNNVSTDTKQTTDLFGTPTSSYYDKQSSYDVTHILSMLRDASTLYDRGVKSRVEVAKEVDKLRRRISSGTFDPHNSPELKNIFGFMFGDVIAGISDTSGGDYDSILDYIMEVFPEGSGGPVESKYVKSQVNNQVNNCVKAIRNYERRNGLQPAMSKGKLVKLLEQFKLAKPDVIVPDLDLLWDAYNK